MKKAIIVVVIIAVLVSVVAFIVINRMEGSEQVNKIGVNTIKNDEIINSQNDDEQEKNISVNGDKITIEIEGETEEIETSKYISSLGYSMQYEKDKFKVSKDEEIDVFEPKEEGKAYYTVEFYPSSYEQAIEVLENKKSTTLNGYETTFSTETADSLIRDYYYIKSETGVYVISIYYPNSSEYIEGWAVRTKAMLQTFKIEE